MLITAAVLTLLGQTPASDAQAQQLLEAAQKSADAAERSARAAERAAEAMEALVKAQARPPELVVVKVPPPPSAPPATTPWTGTAGLSLIWLSGNANTLTFNALGAVDKKWGPWGFGMKGYATYGQSQIPGEVGSQITALAAGGKVRGDRNAGEQVTLFVAAGGETNHVKSVEFVGFGEVGAGVIWISRKETDYEKTFLRTDVSIHYEHETDFTYFPGPAGCGDTCALPSRDLLGPRISGVFRYGLKKDILFSQDAEVIPNVLGTSRIRVNANTKLASRLTETLAMNVSFQLQYDSVPPAGKLPTDTALTLGLELTL